MRFMNRFFSLICIFIALTCIAKAGEPINMAPHLAIYDLQLENASDKSGISGLSGRMAYEFSGTACEGYTTRFRFVTRINMEDMPARLTDQQSTSFESGDGNVFRFLSKTIIDQEVTSETDGSAKRNKQGIAVQVKKPAEAEHQLKSGEFPTMQTLEVIRNAQAGKHFYRTVLFDGSDDADKLTQASVVIGDKQQPVEDAETKVMGAMGKQGYWPVTISYFDDSENQDGLPVYRTSFLLYENGVTRDLVMDYGNFSVRGKMKNLELFDPKKTETECKPE